MSKYAADVTKTEIIINNTPFMVNRYVWGEGENVFTEYRVYEVSRMFGNHSTITIENDLVWGDVSSYFEYDLFAHLKAGTRERTIQVMSYIAFRKSLAQSIIESALGIKNAKII